MHARSLHVIGLMSGSSLDGLDLAACTFHFGAEGRLDVWHLAQATTIAFEDELRHRLAVAPRLSGRDLWLLHVELGRWMGEQVRRCGERWQFPAELVASHGHTVWHMPEQHATAQIGDGAALAVTAGKPVACDFRSVDVALGGQGAPLAPLADALLFPGYGYYLNLGGIANLSVRRPDGSWLAADLTGCNQVLNALALEAGFTHDAGGRLARQGRLLSELLARLDALEWLQQPWPRSLSNQWVQEVLLPLLMQHEGSVSDLLHTAVAHIAGQVAAGVRAHAAVNNRMLVTGGGAHNAFLVDRLRSLLPELELVVPEAGVIEYKEAALIALMGALRYFRLPNVIATATGAPTASVGGALYEPFPPTINEQ